MTTYNRKDRYQIVTDAVIKLMNEHGSDWTKPWQTAALDCHHNKFSKKAYRGTNTFFTALSCFANGFSSNEWGTFKQWQKAGYKIKKGSRGTDIVFFDKVLITDKQTDEQAMVPMLKGFVVFNADQVDGYQSDNTPTRLEINGQHKAAESLVKDTGATIKHGGNRAFYVSNHDYIQMPYFTDFKGTDSTTAEQSYYGTLLHELVHWTGHPSRLHRKLANRFGSNAYAFEELVAETGSALLAAMLGLEKEPTPDHAKYLNNWLEVLKQDKRAMMRAFGLAQKAADHLLDMQANQAIAAE